MKTSKAKLNSNQHLKNILFCLALVLGFFVQGMTQKMETNSKKKAEPQNALSFTPIKGLPFGRVNLMYELMLNKSFSATAETQIWFLDREPVGYVFNGHDEDRSVNKGIRYTLGIRHYSFNDFKSSAFFVGASIFYGEHKISETRVIEISDKTTNTGRAILTSQGAKLTFGVRKIFRRFILEISLDVGKAWSKNGKDTLTLQSDKPDEASTEIDLNNIISGYFAEPTFAVGYKF